MKSNQRGITLVELILYIALTSFVSVLFFTFIVREHIGLISKADELRLFVSANNALDVFRRDLQQAPCGKTLWKKFDKDCLIWRQDGKDICWHKKKDRLMRIEGLYDVASGRWKKAARSTVIIGVKNLELSFGANRDNAISSVVVLLGVESRSNYFEINRNFFVKNGEL